MTRSLTQQISYPLFLFGVGSVMGWCLEVSFRSMENRELITSGFLKGPYCPIYGLGIVLIAHLCSREQKLISFFKIIIFCSLLEYLISWMAEAWFGLILWDYSMLPLSLGTRVNLFFSVAWGVLGIWFLTYLEPRLHQWFHRHAERAFGIGLSVSILLGIDYLMRVLTYLLSD